MRPAILVTAADLAPQALALLGDFEVVYTSRTPDLEAVASRKVRAAGLDAFTPEPLVGEHLYRDAANVILSPHVGGVSEDAYVKMGPLPEELGGCLHDADLLGNGDATENEPRRTRWPPRTSRSDRVAFTDPGASTPSPGAPVPAPPTRPSRTATDRARSAARPRAGR